MPSSGTMIKFSSKQSGRCLFLIYSVNRLPTMKQKFFGWEFITFPAKCPMESCPTLWSSFCNSLLQEEGSTSDNGIFGPLWYHIEWTKCP